MNHTHAIRGLMLKDWYGLRGYLVRQTGLVLAMYLVLGLVLKTMAMLPSMMVMVTMMSGLSAFSLDDACQWNGYACTMNITARQLAKARYILYYGTLFGVMLFSCALATLLEMLLFSGGQTSSEILIMGFGGGIAVFLIYAVMIAVDVPMFYKLGVEKSRIPMTLTFVIPFIAIIPTASYWGPWLDDLDYNTVPWVLIACVALALISLCIYISYRVSVHVLENKEF